MSETDTETATATEVESEVATEAASETEKTAVAPARRRGKRQIADGLAHIHASFNNTIITITDR